jgi:hypothetical protein
MTTGRVSQCGFPVAALPYPTSENRTQVAMSFDGNLTRSTGPSGPRTESRAAELLIIIMEAFRDHRMETAGAMPKGAAPAE